MKTPAKPIPYDELLLERLADRVVEKLRPQLNRILKGMKTMADDINTELAAEGAEEAALAAAVQANTAALTKIRTDLAAALAAAQTQGLTADQVAAFQAIHDKVAADIAQINTDDTTTA